MADDKNPLNEQELAEVALKEQEREQAALKRQEKAAQKEAKKSAPPEHELSWRHYSLKELIRQVKANDLLKNNAVFFIGSMMVAFINYLFYPVLSRFLTVKQFGEVQILNTLTVQLMLFFNVAKTYLITVLTNEPEAKQREIILFKSEQLLMGIALLAILIGIPLSPILANIFHFSSALPMMLLFLITAVSVIKSTRDAYLRATGKFRQVSTGDIIGSSAKLVFSLLFVLAGFGSTGAIGGFLAATIVATMYTFSQTRKLGVGLKWRKLLQLQDTFNPKQLKQLSPQLKIAFSTSIVALVATTLASLDTMFAKHYFPPTLAGLYSGVSVIGNIVYFVTGSISGVLLASVALHKTPQQNLKTFKTSAMLLGTIGAGVLAVFALMPHLVIRIMLGPKYLFLAYLLPRLAFAMFALSITSLVLMYHIALRDVKIGMIAVFGIILISGLLIVNHERPVDIANSFLLGNLILVAVSVCYTGIWNKRSLEDGET